MVGFGVWGLEFAAHTAGAPLWGGGVRTVGDHILGNLSRPKSILGLNGVPFLVYRGVYRELKPPKNTIINKGLLWVPAVQALRSGNPHFRISSQTLNPKP